MKKLRVSVVESVSPNDLYHRQCEGHVVEGIIRLLDGRVSYRIVLNENLLRRAIKTASENAYYIFHLSRHGDEEGIQLSDETDIALEAVADCFQKFHYMPAALVLSSCVGGDGGIARAFKNYRQRPDVIFGAEGKDEHAITFPGACISWPILYTELATLRSADCLFSASTFHT